MKATYLLIFKIKKMKLPLRTHHIVACIASIIVALVFIALLINTWPNEAKNESIVCGIIAGISILNAIDHGVKYSKN